MLRVTNFGLLAMVLVGTACRTETAPGLGDIIRRVDDAMGGEKNLYSITSIWRQRNERTFTLRARGDRHLVVLLNDSGTVRYAEGFDGQEAWEMVDDGPKTTVTDRARTALWHTTQFPGVLKPLSSMARRGHTLELAGVDTLDGVAYYRLILTLSDGFERVYYVNASTDRIERSRDSRRHHAYEEEVQPVESTWSDFRKIDGVWVPFTTGERNFETGERLSGGTMRQIRINVEVSEEVFTPQGSIEPFLELVRELTRSER